MQEDKTKGNLENSPYLNILDFILKCDDCRQRKNCPYREIHGNCKLGKYVKEDLLKRGLDPEELCKEEIISLKMKKMELEKEKSVYDNNYLIVHTESLIGKQIASLHKMQMDKKGEENFIDIFEMIKNVADKKQKEEDEAK